MKHLTFIALLLIGGKIIAQTTLTGRVSDNRNKPIAGASVSLKDTYDGATTDSLGRYQFHTSEKGTAILEVTYTGYASGTIQVSLSEKNIQQNFSLKELVTELKAVVITAGSFEASDKSKGAVLNSIDIVTTPSANGDVTSAFKSLPGTQQVGESEGLFVRGGTAAESKIYIDGAVVNNFFYSSTPGIASRGRFNPFLFKGTVFSTGGYSALYGQALSSALLLESTDLPERSEADFGASVIGLGGGLQHLSKNKKSSWGASYNYANLWLAFHLIPQRQDYYQVPVAHQGDINFRSKTRRGGFIKYYGYISQNQVGFRNRDLDSLVLKDAFELKNLNTYQNLSWKDKLGSDWRFQSALSFSTNRDDIRNELQNENNQPVTFTAPSLYAAKNFNLKLQARYAQARLVLEKRFKGLNALRFGSDYFYSHEKSDYTLYDGSRFSETITDHLWAGFAETDIYLTNSLAAKIGARAEHTTLMNRWNLAPRVSLAYKLGSKTTASLAYGVFYQNPERRYLPAVQSTDFAQATHYIFQFSKQTREQIFRTELFYKKYDHLYKTDFNQFGREVVSNNNGSGYAQGIELFWRDRKSLKSVDYWISYSYLDTKRNYLNYPTSIEPNFAARHTASLVFKHFVTSWKMNVNMSYNYASGRPYYRIAYDQQAGKFEITDQGRTISYNNLGFSLNYLPNIGKKNPKTFAVWVLSVSNVLNQKQIFSYNYSADGLRKEALQPPSRTFVFIGCFLSFGVDRTQDAINNNL